MVSYVYLKAGGRIPSSLLNIHHRSDIPSLPHHSKPRDETSHIPKQHDQEECRTFSRIIQKTFIIIIRLSLQLEVCRRSYSMLGRWSPSTKCRTTSSSIPVCAFRDDLKKKVHFRWNAGASHLGPGPLHKRWKSFFWSAKIFVFRA